MTAVVLRADARCLPLPDASVDLIMCSPPYFGLRSYLDEGYCAACREMERNGRDPKQAWPDYQAHWQEVHAPRPYAGQIGSEATPAEWLANLVECTREWVRVLKPSGSIFVNLGDKYVADNRGSGVDVKRGAAKYAPAGPQGFLGREMGRQKSLLGLPWRYALACMDELGLILRRDIIWSKPNGLPESVTDRCRSSHEYVFHLVKQPRYYAAVDEIREPQAFTGGRDQYGTGSSGNGHKHRAFYGAKADYNPLGKLPGSVWSIPSQPLVVPAHLGVDHFAAFPLELPRRIIAGWSPPGICTACGEGRRPVSDHDRTFDGEAIGPGTGGIFGDVKRLSRNQGVGNWRFGSRTTITGYACACPLPDAPTRPSIVLDPFSGTGTTMLAASALGRAGIGCDLSMDYARLARWRTQDRAEIAKAMQVPKPPPVPDGQEALFT